MALEEAGVSLVAENFRKYIRELDAINKKQQAVFDVDSKRLSKAFDDAIKLAESYERGLDKAKTGTKGIGSAAVKAGDLARGAIDKLAGSIINLGQVATTTFVDIVKGGVALNQQFDLSERVFTNVFGDPKLGKATVDFLNETADRLRIARGEASSFAQVVLPRTQNLEEFTELLRLTDIQADTTGQSLEELKLAGAEAIAGDFSRLKERFDIGTTLVNQIKSLTPELGASGALVKVLGDEFARLGKQDISGTLGTNIKDLQSTFTNFQSTLGKPVFEQLRVQSTNLIEALDRNDEGLQRTAIALGEVSANAVELVGTELVEFIDSLDFGGIETGIDNLNRFVEALRVLIVITKEVFKTGVLQISFGLLTGSAQQVVAGLNKIKQADFGQAFDNISEATKNASVRQGDYKKRIDEAASAQSSFTKENEDLINTFLGQQAAQDRAKRALESYTNVLKQAQQLQLSFSRQAEDAAIRLARANEDVARKQVQDVAKLEERQAKDREKLLKNQTKQLDRFEKKRRKQIANAENNIREARREAAEDRKRDQQKLQRDLARAQERFNLDQLQSQRRFKLAESRLIAEGDILGLKRLREDNSLRQQEDKENFDLSKKEQVQTAEERQKEQAKDLEKRLKELKVNLEDQRADLLASFDEQLRDQQEAQAEARTQQQRAFEEAAAERAIQLQREEEDRRLSQARQLEDLGRSFAEQEGITAEGTQKIASELEKVFGIEGAADNIFKGFTSRTENEFTDLFDNLEKIVKKAEDKIQPKSIKIEPVTAAPSSGPLGLPTNRIGGIPEFQAGGTVPGPVGSPQLVVAHGGEQITPVSRTMAAPIIPSQNLNVNMAGGFNISGNAQADEQILRAATQEMTETFRIAINRVVRRN